MNSSGFLLPFPPEMPSDFSSSPVPSPDHTFFSFAGLRPMNAAERRWQVQGRRSGARLAGAGGDRSGQRCRSAGGVHCCTASAREKVRKTEDDDCSNGPWAGGFEKKEEKKKRADEPSKEEKGNKKEGRKKDGKKK